jgi:hypothetical protein
MRAKSRDVAVRLAPFVPALLLLGVVFAFEHPGRAPGEALSAAALALALPLAVVHASKALAVILSPPVRRHPLEVALPGPLAPLGPLVPPVLLVLLVLMGWARPGWVVVALLPCLLVPAGMLLGGALDALAVRAGRRAAGTGAPVAVTGALVAAGFALALGTAAAGQALAPRSPPSLVAGLVALSWGALTGTAVAAGVLAAALAGRGRRQAASRAARVLVFTTVTAALLGYTAGALGPGLLSPSGTRHVPLPVLVLLAASVVTAPAADGDRSEALHRVVPPQALSDLLVSATAGVVSLVLLGERLGGFPWTPLVATVALAALLAGGAGAVVLRGRRRPVDPSPSHAPPAGVHPSGAPARAVLIAGLVLLLLLHEVPRRELDLASRTGTGLAWAVFVLAGWRAAGAFEPLARRVARSRRRARLLPWLVWAAALFYPAYFPVQDYLLGILRAGGRPWEGLGPSLASLAFLALAPGFFLSYVVVIAALLALFAAAGMLMAWFLGDLAEAALPPPEGWRRPWPGTPWALLGPATAVVAAALIVPGELPENRYGWGLGVAVLGLAVAVPLLAATTLRAREPSALRTRRVARDLIWAVLLGWFVGYTMGEAREIGAEGAVPYVALVMAGLKVFEIALETPERSTRAGLAPAALPDLLLAVVAALLLVPFIQTVAPAAAVVSIKEAERMGLMAGAILLPVVRAFLGSRADQDRPRARSQTVRGTE